MGTKELNETLGVLNRRNGDQPSISSANYLRTLERLEEINRDLQKAIYNDSQPNQSKTSK